MMDKEKLITEVSRRPEIWDKRERRHRDRNLVDSLWDEVSLACGADKSHVKKTWKNLVDHFRNIYYEIVCGKPSEDGPEDVTELFNKVKWCYFKQMLFLKDVISTRRTISSLLPQAEMNETEAYGNTVDEVITFETYSTSPENSFGQNNSYLMPVQLQDNSSATASPTDMGPQKRKKRKHSDELVAQELNKAEAELNKPDDKVKRFVKHLEDVIREVPENDLRRCFQDILAVANSYADGRV